MYYLGEAMDRMGEQSLEYLPVVDGREGLGLVGVLEARKVRRLLSQEILRRRRAAEETDGPAAQAFARQG